MVGTLNRKLLRVELFFHKSVPIVSDLQDWRLYLLRL